MSVIFYSGPDNEHGKRLRRVIEMVVSRSRIEAFRTVSSLAGRFRMPTEAGTVVVLHASGQKDLDDIVGIREYLVESRMILVLPGRDEETVAKGHILRPRLMTYEDSDFLEVAAVLGRLKESRTGRLTEERTREAPGRSCRRRRE